jgi:CcmD family protein
MPKHFWYLFAAYSVIWLALMAYVLRLVGRTGELRRDLDRLQGETLRED